MLPHPRNAARIRRRSGRFHSSEASTRSLGDVAVDSRQFPRNTVCEVSTASIQLRLVEYDLGVAVVPFFVALAPTTARSVPTAPSAGDQESDCDVRGRPADERPLQRVPEHAHGEPGKPRVRRPILAGRNTDSVSSRHECR
jgi:hypothetical protein